MVRIGFQSSFFDIKHHLTHKLFAIGVGEAMLPGPDQQNFLKVIACPLLSLPLKLAILRQGWFCLCSNCNCSSRQ